MDPVAILAQAKAVLRQEVSSAFSFKRDACLTRIRALQGFCTTEESLVNVFLEDIRRNRKWYIAEEEAKHGEPLPSGAEESRTVILSNENMEYFTRHGSSVEGLESAARTYLETRNYEDSFRCYRILTMIIPKYPAPWVGAGMALYRKDSSRWPGFLGQPISASNPPPVDAARKAIEYFDKALELDESNHLAWYYKGSSLAMVGQFSGDAAKVKEGLHCFRQALLTRPGDPDTTKAIREFQSLYATLRPSSGEAEAVCDVCGFPTNFAESYSLTTKQVVPTVEYWENALKVPFQALLRDEQDAVEAFGKVVAQQASHITGWLVCEACSGLFHFDRAAARQYALKRISPPDAGPLSDPKEALAAALTAKMKLKQGMPNSALGA